MEHFQTFIKNQWKRITIFGLFVILTIASLRVGVLEEGSFKSLFAGDELSWTIMLHSRVPRTMAIILAAASLSVAGLIMQAISRNKFMSPSTSGTTDAAALGILIAYVSLGTQPSLVQALFAFLFALVSTLLFTSVIGRLKIRDVVYVPLIGMMYGGLISGVTTSIAYRFNVLQMLTSLNLGSFARLGNFALVYIVIIPLVFSVIYSSRFSIVGMGEDFSKNLGLNYNRIIFLGLVIIALISASTYVAVGPMPFIGLIIPNMTTSFYGDNIKRSIIDIMFFGADFVLLCDILSRLVIFPFEMSVSITISIIGGIVFMVYLVRGMRNGKTR